MLLCCVASSEVKMKTAQSNLVRILPLMVFTAISIAAPGVTWGSSDLEDRVIRLEKLVEGLSQAPSENRWSCSSRCWYSDGPINKLTLMVASGQTSGEAFMKVNQECRIISNTYGVLAVDVVEINRQLVANPATITNSCVRN